MAFKTILFPFLCFLVSSTAEQNCSEYQCSLVPVGEDLSSEFQLKASEKGVKLVYLQVKIIGNDSYGPLDVPDEFLPDWWVYTRSISEPMLSLPYDYDALSLGLLNYQVRSMTVPLIENPAGCLGALNSSCQNKAIGRALLKNVTRTNHKVGEVDVVCVQVIKYYTYFQLLYHEDNLEYDCCIREKNSMEIRCNQSARTTVWLEAFNVVLLILQGVLMLCFPGFPRALPGFIINLQEELEKEKQEEKVLENELDSNNQGQELTEDQRFRDHYQRDSSTEGDQNLSETEILVHSYDGRTHTCTNSSPVRSEGESHDGDNQGQVQGGVCGHNRRDSSTGGDHQHPSEEKSVYMDDASPITFCNLLKKTFIKYSGCLQYLKFPFNIKLALLVIVIAPFFFYVRIILALTIKRRVFDESAEKNDAFLDGLQLFSLHFFHLNSSLDITILVLLSVVPFLAVFFLRPQDFMIDKESFEELECLGVCIEHSSSVGEDMRRHIENWRLNFKWFVIRIIETHSYVITRAITAIKCTACVRHIKSSERLKRTIINAFCLLPSYIFIFLFFGVILGLVGFVILLVGFIVISVFYSPLACVLKIAYLKLLSAYMSGAKSSFECIRCKTSIQQSVLFHISAVVSTVFYFFISFPLAFLIFFLAYWVTLPCFLAALSGRFLVRMFGLTVMGLVFDREIVTHFLAFLTAAVANLSLCYYNFQNAYKEIKVMIFKYRQKHRPQNCSVDTGEDQSFPEDLFWYVIDDYRVLPMIPEFYWMLVKMAVILIFLFCALCSAIFNDHRDFGAVYFTIYLFATGAIAGLVFKGMTIGKRFTGARKQKMEKQIEDAVISFYGRRREVVERIYTHV
ncbi:uncharacterized protein [Porites lutea]|uniref:uncharacterized protein n=1 Tax=Porites lutea TaxID=51062 RepID=UPI003CC6D60C